MKTRKLILTAAVMASIAGSAFAANQLPSNMELVHGNSARDWVVSMSDTAVAVGSNLNSNATKFVAVGENVTANGEKSIGIGHNVDASGTNSIAVGVNASATTLDGIAIGNNAKNVTGNGAGIAIGRNTESHELATTVGTDAKGTNWGSTAIGTIAKATGNQSTALGNNANASNSYATAVGVSSSANGIYANAMGISSMATAVGSNALGSLTHASGKYSTALGFNSEASGEYSTAIGFNSKASGLDSIAIGHGVKAIGDRAINIGTNNVYDGTLQYGTIVGNGNSVNHFSDNKSARYAVVFGDVNTIEDSDDGVVIGAGSTIQIADHSVAIGNNVKVTAPNSIGLGNATFVVPDAVVDTPSAMIAGTNHTFAGGHAVGTLGIGVGRAMDESLNGERTITGVAAGRISDTSTDAINGSQLHAVISEVDRNANNINGLQQTLSSMGNQFGNLDTLNSKVDRNQLESRRGIASATALAALHPLDYNPDHKLDVMGGVGHYRNQTAMALGVAYRPNANVMFTLGTSINGKDTAINAGVSYKVGAKDIEYRSQASMAKDIDDLKVLVNKLVAENEALKANTSQNK